jgi:phosphoribosylamine--glycine ligase
MQAEAFGGFSVKILVIGSGGREHALSWKLAQEEEVVCAPGNPGMDADVETRPLDVKDHIAVIELARGLAADVIVVGPEDPLVDGLGESLRDAGFAVYGPGAEWARLEGSKAFSKALMAETGIPTAAFETFTEAQAAIAYAKRCYAEGGQLAVKASGNALGKGVIVAATVDEATEAIERMMVHREFGEAGRTVVLEERLIGREFSLLTLIGDRNHVSLPVAQDHKRAYDGDQGPNTGGMGAFSPCDWIDDALIEEVERTMVEPVFQAIGKSASTYRGTLFTGVMVTDKGPRCLEFNVRFGDPETQAVMMRLGNGFAQALNQAATGRQIDPPEVLGNASIAVVVASGGYPGSYKKGVPIRIAPGYPPRDRPTKLFWAGVSRSAEGIVTSGGRVVAATASAPNYQRARELAYEAARGIDFEGGFYRADIGPAQVRTTE